MKNDNVLIVLTNYSRPQNMGRIINAWREQTHKEKTIVVADNSPAVMDEGAPISELDGADDVWSWLRNSGCPCHFYPALSYTPSEYPYTIFADDDLMPGRNALEVLLNHAHLLNNQFSTIGQIGRTFLLDKSYGNRYSGRNSNTRDVHLPVKTHLTCRAHMIRTEYLPYVLSFRNRLSLHSREGNRLSQIHDDFLLCMGIQVVTKYPSYLTMVSRNIDNELVRFDLDDAKAVWRKPGHWEDRNKMVDLSIELGWNPAEIY